MNLNGKTAIVTGGTKGIGRAIAEALVREGISVCIAARKQDEIDTAIRDLGGAAVGFVCDVRDYDRAKALIDYTVKRLGGLDILVNNAGIGIFETVAETSPEDFRAVLETNLFGVFYCCHEAIPEMKRRGGGYIINISSLAGANPHPRMAAYNASKFGLNGFTEALMQEVRHDGIKVSYIMPGSVNTEFGGDSPGDEKSWQLTPQDIARVVVDLLHHDDRALPSRVEIQAEPATEEIMRAVVQRVTRANVTVDDQPVGEIGNGLVVLLGIARDDTKLDAAYLVEKIAALRIFDDEAGKMNLSLKDVSGGMLVISQFTLYGDVRRGLRPSWIDAAAPEVAEPLYDFFVRQARTMVDEVATGSFRAMMQVELVNDGPVTILLDSKKLF